MIINYQSFLVNLLITDSINKHSVRISFPGLGECKYINISLAVKLMVNFLSVVSFLPYQLSWLQQ